MNIWIAGIIGFLAEGIGVTTGIMMLILLKFEGKRLQGMMMGFTAGLMTAIICFDILPEAFNQSGVLIAIIGVICGLSIGLSLDNIVNTLSGKLHNYRSKHIKIGVVLVVAVALHSIPEGIALGTLLSIAPQTGIRVAFVVALHSIPEGIAIAIPLKLGKVSKDTLGLICIILATLMGSGVLLGYAVSILSPIIVTLSMGFAAGVILYIVCEELIPESKEIWNGRLTTVAAIIGVIIGIIITVGV